MSSSSSKSYANFNFNASSTLDRFPYPYIQQCESEVEHILHLNQLEERLRIHSIMQQM